MADDNLIFPIGFDLEAGVKAAEKNADAFLQRLQKAINSQPLTIKINADGFAELGRSMENLTASLARLNGLLTNKNTEATTAEQRLTQAITEQGSAVANTTNTISRQLMGQERVNKALRDAYTEQEKVNSLISQYHDTYEGQVASLARLNAQLAVNKKAQSDNAKALKQGEISAEEYAEANNQLLAQHRQLSVEKRALNQVMTAEEKAMLAQEGSYKQLSQQLSLLKTAYKELGNEGRNSQFGLELEATIQNLDAHLKDMAADMGEFQRNVGNYAIAGQNGVVATESLTAAINQEARTTQDLIDQTKILEEAKRMLNKDDANYQSTLAALNSKLDENKRKLSDVSDILGKEAKSVAEAEAQNKRLSEAIKHVDLKSANAEQQLEALRAQINKNNQTINAATGANERYADTVLGLVGINDNFGSSLQSLGEGGNFIDGLKIKVQAFGKTLLGLLANPAVLAFLGIAGVAAGFKWWYGYNKGLVEASKLTQDLTGLTGDSMKAIRNEVQAVADTYNKDFREVLKGANSLAKQFGIPIQEAMQLVKDGFVAGADANGEFLENIKEYPAYFKEAGISASEFIAITTQATKAGVYSDKGVDTIKEGNIRLREMTKATAKALDGIGISSKQVQKELSDGSKSTFDVMQQVSAKLAELPESSSKVGAALADIFGGPGEDAGLQYILTLKDIDTNLDNVKGRAGELGRLQEEQLQSQIELENTIASVFDATGGSFESLTTHAKIFINKGIIAIIRGCVDIVNWFINIYNEASYVRVGVANIVVTFKTLWTIAKGLFELLINGFKSAGSLAEGFALILSGEFQSGASRIKDAVTNGFKGMKDIAIKYGKELGANFTDGFNNIAERKLNNITVGLKAEDINPGANQNADTRDKGKELPDSAKALEAAETYLQILNKIEQSITTINAKYNDLAKKEGNAKALEHINELYKTQLTYINAIGRQFGLSFKMPTSFESLQEYRKAILDVINKLKARGVKGAEDAALELETKIGTGDVEKLGKEVEEKIKQLTDEVSRTKTAREFYDKVLGMTGDYDLASKVSMSIYGGNGSDLKQQLAKQIRKLTNDIELPEGIISADNIVDYKALREWAELNKDELTSTYAELVKIAEQGQKDLAKTYEGYLKDLEKAKTYSDKRIELARYTANKIAEINASDLPQEEKARMTAGYAEREDKEAAKLEYEAFKDSALYIQMFEDLDYASTSALERMRDRLIKLKGEWKNLDPTQIKELQARLKEIDEQIAQRNPFKALGDAWKKWQELRNSGRTKEGDETAAQAAEDARQAAKEKMLADERAYQAVAKATGETSVAAIAMRAIADKSKVAYDNAEKTANETAEQANDWKIITELIDKANQKIDGYQEQINNALDGVRKTMEAFGTSEEDMQFFDDVVGGLNEIVDAGQQAATSVGAFATGNIFGGITSGVSAIGGLVSGFTNLFYAGRVKRANKEIKKQQEILENLEYSYDRLQAASDNLFGSDYLQNYNQQIKNLQAQQQAYQKQAEAERSKGKKKDKDKIKEYENSAKETADKIKELQDDLVAQIAGTDVASAARDFANAWLDAYLSFGSTTDAIKEKFDDMIKNMIVNMVLAQVVKRALEPVFEMIDKLAKDGELTGDDIAKVFAMVPQAMNDINNGLNVGMEGLKAAGVDISKLREGSSEFSGIAKQVASASSEEINANTAALNTQNFYMAQIHSDVAAMRALMEGGGGATIPTAAAGWTDWQQQAMDSYTAIQRNTADAVVECRRIALACEEEVAQLRRVIVPRGTKGSHGVQVYM